MPLMDTCAYTCDLSILPMSISVPIGNSAKLSSISWMTLLTLSLMHLPFYTFVKQSQLSVLSLVDSALLKVYLLTDLTNDSILTDDTFMY